MPSPYDALRRLLVGTNEKGYPVTMRCFINEDASATECKFYIGRFVTAYDQEIVQNIHESFQFAGESPEEQAKAMRCAWFKKFAFVGQDVQAELDFHDEAKRMRVAYTIHHEEIWMTWELVNNVDICESEAKIAYWKSPTSWAKHLKISNINEMIDLNTMIPDIHLRGTNDWKSTGLNMLAARYNLEEPPEEEKKSQGTSRKRTGSQTPVCGRHGSIKKPKLEAEINGEEPNYDYATSTPRSSLMNQTPYGH